MKRTALQIGYMAGILERRSHFHHSPRLNSNLMITTTNEALVNKLRSILKQDFRVQTIVRRGRTEYTIVMSIASTVGWLMTVYSLLTPNEQASARAYLQHWRLVKRVNLVYAKCHPELPHKARGLCQNCYNRDWYKRNVHPYVERPIKLAL